MGRGAGPRGSKRRASPTRPGPSKAEPEGSDDEAALALPASRPAAKATSGAKQSRGRGSGGSKRAKKAIDSEALKCGRCKALQAAGTPWPEAPGPDGNVRPVGAACKRCWEPYRRCWQRIGFEWPLLCGQCHEDASFDQQFEETCKIWEGKATADFDQVAIDMHTEIGIETSVNYVCLKDEQVKEATGFTPKQLGEKKVTVPSPYGGNTSGVIVKPATEPVLHVKVFARTNLTKSKAVMSAQDHLVTDQASKVFDARHKAWKKQDLPTALRGQLVPPSLEDLKRRADGIRRGTGGSDDEDGGTIKTGLGDDDEQHDEDEDGEEEEEAEVDEVIDSGGEGGAGVGALEAAKAGKAAPADSSPPANSPNAKALSQTSLQSPRQPSEPPSSSKARPSPSDRSRMKSGSPGHGPDRASNKSSSGNRGSPAFHRQKSIAMDDSGSLHSQASTRTAATGCLGKDGEKEISEPMRRYRDLERRCDCFGILSGKSKGHEIYAARRFRAKTTDASAIVKTKKLVELCEVCERVTMPTLALKAWPDISNDLEDLHKRTKGKADIYPVKWCTLVAEVASLMSEVAVVVGAPRS